MNKWLFSLVVAPAVLVLSACSSESPSDTGSRLRVAATVVPHAEILEFVKPELAKQGVELEIREFNDYVQPNSQVAQRQMDLNYFQTGPYLDEFNRDHGTHLVRIVGVHIEPLGAYSRKHKVLTALPDGGEVIVPNDPSNLGRALLLLDKAGIIKLRDRRNPVATPRDIVENPKHLRFRQLDAAMLPRVFEQVDLAMINTNYALDAGLDPTVDALVIEDGDSPYVNYLVGRPDNQNDPRTRKLAAALTSEAVRKFIVEKYQGAVLPAF
ncbi:MAG: MetQ/NlpA family ABC transporter substrate-binding protein [Xanthomonadaceae bacterium]|jgi:D-methionine transport system substrate-binding protein|nr:MetQ/NlpA family ABC transporter substrate-binding protein [Xanthomonadaceae bacterium]